MKQSSKFTKRKVCKSSKGWYVYFYFNGKQKCYKKGINYIKNIYQREIEANSRIKNNCCVYAKIRVNLKRKNSIFLTPLNCALKALIFALKDSAEALVLLLIK